MELVSVVIPTFNSEGFIEEAIDSVVAQKYPSIEIIVVDDRSNDNSVAVARHKLQRSADRFQILELDANKGPSGARNAGLRVANGSWVQFLDSDDVLSPQKIKRQMAVSEIAEPDVAAIYSPWNWGFLEAGKIEWFGPLNEPSMSGRAPIMCLAAKCRPLLGACLIRRSVLEQAGGFDETLRFWECEEVCVRLASIGRFVSASSGEAEYLWRLHTDGPYIAASGGRYTTSTAGLGWIKLALRVSGSRGLDTLGLPDPDKQLLLLECTAWGRALYMNDRAAFHEFLSLARTLEPDLAPSDPPYIKALSQLIGYENAEAAYMLMRLPKMWLRSTLNTLGLRQRRYTMVEGR
jgi:glycosyltransferase involved in cell wall biosynthesis